MYSQVAEETPEEGADQETQLDDGLVGGVEVTTLTHQVPLATQTSVL